MREAELPDVWIDKPTRLTTDGVADAWTYQPWRNSVRYVPAARLNALRVDCDNWEKQAFVYMDERDRERVRLDALRTELDAVRAKLVPPACCQQFELCREKCVPLTEHWRERAERAERELEAARADAARYRWLRGDAPTHSERWPRWNLQRWDGRCWHSLEQGALDAAIDASRKERT